MIEVKVKNDGIEGVLAMVKNSLFFVILVGVSSSWHSAEGVLIEGSKWWLGQKEILFFCDLHNQVQWEEREKDELEDLVTFCREYAQTDNKPLHILIEEIYNPYAHDHVFSLLRMRLELEEFSSKIIIENIEQRAASAMAVNVIKDYPHLHPDIPRVSSTQACYPDTVTVQDVLNEFDLMSIQFDECYSVSSDKEKRIHDEHGNAIKRFREDLKQTIANNRIPLDVPFIILLETCLTEEQWAPYKDLKILIEATGHYFLDLYAFHRVLTISDDYKVVLIAGGEHSDWVRGEMMGTLDAIRHCRYGTRIGEIDELNPLTTEQLKSLLYA